MVTWGAGWREGGKRERKRAVTENFPFTDCPLRLENAAGWPGGGEGGKGTTMEPKGVEYHFAAYVVIPGGKKKKKAKSNCQCFAPILDPKETKGGKGPEREGKKGRTFVNRPLLRPSRCGWRTEKNRREEKVEGEGEKRKKKNPWNPLLRTLVTILSAMAGQWNRRGKKRKEGGEGKGRGRGGSRL